MKLTVEQRIERLELILYGRKQKQSKKAKRPLFNDKKRVLAKLQKNQINKY